MSPQRRAELIAELDVLTREARRVASNRGVLRASRRDAKAAAEGVAACSESAAHRTGGGVVSVLKVTLAEAPTDVLVYLVDHGPTDALELLRAVVPPDTEQPTLALARAVGLLVELGYADMRPAHVAQWAATPDGTAAVNRARAEATS